MNGLLVWAIAVLIASGAGMFWAIPYRQNHPMAAVGAFFGSVDPTYALAGWVAGGSVLAFLVGIGLLIAGLVRATQTPQAEPVHQPGNGGSSTTPASFNRAKWNALLQYDNDILAAVESIRPLGSKWADEFASSYLALNDKTYIPEIIRKVTARAKAEAEELEQARLQRQQQQEAYEREQWRVLEESKARFRKFRDFIWGTKNRKIGSISAITVLSLSVAGSIYMLQYKNQTDASQLPNSVDTFNQICPRALTNAQAVNFVPYVARLVTLNAQPVSSDHYLCTAEGRGITYSITVKVRCNDLSQMRCAPVMRVTTDSGQVLWQALE